MSYLFLTSSMNIQPNAVATRDKTLAIMGVFSSNVYTTATYTR